KIRVRKSGIWAGLFAVQYLPQSVILIKGLLTVFQSTSTAFWYHLVKLVVKEVSSRLAARDNKVETIGKKEGSGKVVERLLLIMKSGIRFDPNTSLITWFFSNFGSKADCEVDETPNFALNFLHKA